MGREDAKYILHSNQPGVAVFALNHEGKMPCLKVVKIFGRKMGIDKYERLRVRQLCLYMLHFREMVIEISEKQFALAKRSNFQASAFMFVLAACGSVHIDVSRQRQGRQSDELGWSREPKRHLLHDARRVLAPRSD